MLHAKNEKHDQTAQTGCTETRAAQANQENSGLINCKQISQPPVNPGLYIPETGENNPAKSAPPVLLLSCNGTFICDA